MSRSLGAKPRSTALAAEAARVVAASTAARGGRPAVLAAVVATSLLIAKRHPTHPLRKIAQTWPDFLLDTETALEVTGEAAHHQQGSSPDHAEIDKLRDFTYECLRALLAPTGQDTNRTEEKTLS